MTPRYLDARATADLLFDQGIGLKQIATDDGLGRAIADVCWRSPKTTPAGRCSNDFEGIRFEMRLLWGEAGLQGRRVECQRYAVAGRLQ